MEDDIDKKTGYRIFGLLYEKSRRFTSKHHGQIISHFDHREDVEEILKWAYQLGKDNASENLKAGSYCEFCGPHQKYRCSICGNTPEDSE